MKNTLLASAGSRDGIERLASQYFGGSTITLAETGGLTWSVATGKGLTSLIVVFRRGRYRLESPAIAASAKGGAA
jgi:hypothetical protein